MTTPADPALTDRQFALEQAVNTLAASMPPATSNQVLHYAAAYNNWLAQGGRLIVVVGTTFEKADPSQTTPTKFDGGSVQLTDAQGVDLSITPEDSAGQPTADTLTWASDNPSVVTVDSVSTDTKTARCLAGAPGSANVTATDPNGLTATEPFVVVGGPVTSLVVSEGTPFDKSSPPAPLS